MNPPLELVCPRDRSALVRQGESLRCDAGHVYPIFDDVPVMLVDDVEGTHGYIDQTMALVRARQRGEPVPFRTPPVPLSGKAAAIDAYVQGELPYTCGGLYFASQYRLTRYPIPKIPLPPATKRERLLDVGCNWGRWSIAAARLGYDVIGIDPSLEAVLAARRVCAQVGVTANFVVGDARYLPFAAGTFATGYSYGVFQHLSKQHVAMALAELHRVVAARGSVVVQMPNQRGPRARYLRWRRGYSEGEGFDVRYWTPEELLSLWTRTVGGAVLSADSYFGLGIQAADADLLAPRYRPVTYASDWLVRLSRRVPALVRVADSVFLHASNTNP